MSAFELIQKQGPGRAATPLFLLHDASETVSRYHALGALERDVYAMPDLCPEHDRHESMSQLSRRYYASIKKIVPDGRILLAGWSLGGMIALQVAWFFDRDPRVSVDGLIMGESPFSNHKRALPYDIEFCLARRGQSAEARKLEKSILRTLRMLQGWRIPASRQARQPRTVIMCARERDLHKFQHALSLVDHSGDGPTTGWNRRSGCALVESNAVQRHHFAMFELGNIASVSKIMSDVTFGMQKSADEDEMGRG